MFKFLNWSKKKDKAPEVLQDLKEDDLLPAAMEVARALPLQYTNLDLRRSVLDWRDKHMELIEIDFQRELHVLNRDLRSACGRMQKSDILKHQSYTALVIQPLYSHWVTVESKKLLDAAQSDIAHLYKEALANSGDDTALESDVATTHASDSKQAAVALSVGAAGIPVIGSLSVVSAGGLAGFFGATVIAWPVVAVGSVVVGGLLLFGGKRIAGMKERAIASYEAKLIESIRDRVLGGSKNTDSVVARLQKSIDAYATSRLEEIDKC